MGGAANRDPFHGFSSNLIKTKVAALPCNWPDKLVGEGGFSELEHAHDLMLAIVVRNSIS